MKKLAYIVVSMLFCILQLPSHAQNLSVESFVLAETDLTANTPGTMYKDQNGEICALIKVETTQKGFTFDVGVMGVSSVKEMPGEIWVYVPFGIRKISVHHPALGVLRDYPIPVHIDKGRTYIMKLTSGNVRTIVESVPTKQYLSIVLEPADAMLEINGKVKITENGGYQELLNFGTYNYRVTSPDYHELTGEVVINDPDDAHELILKLKPAFGFVSVVQNANPDIIGANVYVDNSYVGKIPLNNHRLKSGTHSIRIIKEMYEVYNDMFIVSDEENKVIAPELVPDFAEVTLQTGTGADIYVDGEYKARHRWTGRLASGSYIFETRQSGHLPYKTSYEITRGDDSKVITIEDPIPLYGSLNI
ncbi:MAG: PEGA domain-containing protein, partial [Bacteroidales bacterium]|nr:PEGA domain-containing protein [Bacteroidales bacterium]